MRILTLVLVLAALAGAAAAQPRDPALCAALFRDYDQKAWLYPNQPFRDDDRARLIAPALERPTRLLRNHGCLTLSSDLDGMPALAARLAPYRIERGGAAIRPVPVHLGVVTSIIDEARATAFFRGLGYRSRGIGAAGLGRRLYIGPFTSQGAVDQALATAREAGFISPFVPYHTKF
jgi:hypothetical protein